MSIQAAVGPRGRWEYKVFALIMALNGTSTTDATWHTPRNPDISRCSTYGMMVILAATCLHGSSARQASLSSFLVWFPNYWAV